MQKIYSFQNAINFTKNRISLLLLILLSVTAYSNPIEKSADRKRGYNFLTEKPWLTSGANSKGKGAYSTDDCTYSLSADSLVTWQAGTGTVDVAAGEACTWTATKDVSWITFTTVVSRTGGGRVRYSYTRNTESYPPALRTGRINIAGQTYTVTQLPPPITPDNHEGITGNNTSALAWSLPNPAFNNENASTLSLDANCHNVEDVDFYKITLSAGYSYTISGALYGWNNQMKNSNVGLSLDTKISYSTNGSTWNFWGRNSLSSKVVPGGTLYLKIEPDTHGRVGTYAARIDIKKAAKTDCIYTLLHTHTASLDAGDFEVTVQTAGSACAWTATSNDPWITLTAGQSTTGAGTVRYEYAANMAADSRTGTITIAAQTYTLTQDGRPLTVESDTHEPNNTVANATLPTMILMENTYSVSIQANCHINADVDIYRINLEAGYSYTLNGSLYYLYNQNDNSNYTLVGKISYSTDNGSTWSVWETSLESDRSKLLVPAGTLYFKIEPYRQGNYFGNAGTYAAKIELKKAATTGCTYVVPGWEEEVTWEAKTGQQIEVRASSSVHSSCVRTATSNADWITLTAGQSGTGNGYVVYSCTANTSNSSRKGTIAIADKTYTVIQGIQPDTYEPNNTVENATPLTATFTDHASTLSISGTNCHSRHDLDIYQINLEAGYHYTISGDLYDLFHNPENGSYTMNADISYSTNGSIWHEWGGGQLPIRIVTDGETLYLKIEPAYQRWIGTYAARIAISREAGCTHTLSPKSKQETAGAGTTGLVTVTASSLCTSSWTPAVASGANWLTITSGLNATTGSGEVRYSFTANTTQSLRTGTITMAGKTYTVIQAPPSLPPDIYEGSSGNNTSAQAYTFPPQAFNQENVSTYSISPANCHNMEDVDIYKINLEAGYIYTIAGALYDQYNRTGGSSYTLDVKSSYSTTGSNWTDWGSNQLSGKTVQAGTLYLKIESNTRGDVGTYAARIDIIKAANAGCTYSLLLTGREETTPETGGGQINVTTGPSCLRTAVSNENWITLTAGKSETGSGNVDYTYKANRSAYQRSGTILVADQTFTITQAARLLEGDGYEPNNTVEGIGPFSILTPQFNANTSILSIAPATCHINSDIDIYKINLGTAYSYTINYALYDQSNQIDNSNYSLYGKISWSTNGTNWIYRGFGQVPTMAMEGIEILYLKIEPNYISEWNVGTYEVKIDITKTLDCRPGLTPESRVVSSAAGQGGINVTTNSLCPSPSPWTATLTSATDWLTLPPNQSGTGNGQVSYTYTENNTGSSRTATISIGGRTYTLTQAPHPLPPDSYEPNNTVAQPHTFTPVFAANAYTVNISPANCHDTDDVDIYKINLGAGYSYRVRAILYDKYNRNGNSDHTLEGKILYSTDGSTWNNLSYRQLWGLTVPGEGSIYFKIMANSPGGMGSYAAKIDVNIAGTIGCIFSLSGTEKQASSATGNDQITLTTTSACFWAAFTDYPWITVTSQSGTGTRNVTYTYLENRSTIQRTGTISIAGHTFTLTQAGSSLAEDSYEPNNTVTNISQAGTFTPVFTENESTLSISQASYHNGTDIDIYKIILEAGHSYTLSGMLYDSENNQANNNSYTLDVKSSWSTNGTSWHYWGDRELLSPTVQGGNLYIKIEPYYSGSTGTYGARIDLQKITTTGCTYRLSANSKQATTSTGTDRVTVTVSGLCTSPWTATSNDNWITLTSGHRGTTVSGEVAYSYSANTALGSRTGTITIAGQTYTVTQAGTIQPDRYEPNNTVAEAGLRPLIPTFRQTTGTLSISANSHSKEDVDIYKITLGADFYTFNVLYEGNETNISWSTDGTTWKPASWNSGNQRSIPVVQRNAIYLKFEPYTYTWKAGIYSVKIDIYTAASIACTYTLPITDRGVTAAAGLGKVEVTTDASCTWAADSNDDWIRVNSNRSTTGSGSVGYSYRENSTANSRTGTITVAGRTYRVTQASIPPDVYEENNTVANASLLTPLFTQNTSTISISANCHTKEDVDIYKIDSGTDTYAISAEVLNRGYSFESKTSYSTNAGSTWTESTDRKLPGLAVQGIIYLKIELKDKSRDGSMVGAYEASIAISKAAVAGCTYRLPAANRQVTWEAGTGKVDIETHASCIWSAVSHDGWITVVSGRNQTGSGSIAYSYTENTSTGSRTGRLTIAGHTYSVTQAAIQADGYEENNTVEQANLRPVLTPVFTQNASRISISPANFHTAADVDIYKINLGADSCIVKGELYSWNNQNYNSRYMLSTKISWSSDGSTWSAPEYREFSSRTAKGIIYLKILPAPEGQTGSYTMKIAINKASVADCTYSLADAGKQVTWEAGDNRINVTTTSDCVWAAASQADWITVGSESRTGSGSVSYSYNENTKAVSRTGKITAGGKVYKVTQAPLQADAYEENNTVEQANLRPALTPVFTQNTGRISISSANCHTDTDVDIYKINLGTDSCVVSGVLFHRYGYYGDYRYADYDVDYNRYYNRYYDEDYDGDNDRYYGEDNNKRYTLYARISYSTDGTHWTYSQSRGLSDVGVKGSLYIKIEPAPSYSDYGESTGSYAVKLIINKAVTAGCTYSLQVAGREATAESGAGKAEVTTNSSCAWTAVSNADWISLTSGRSRTGSGSVGYTYTNNMAMVSRTGTITAAGKTYTLTQAGVQSLSPDGYEPNDTKESAWPFTPLFTQNTATLSIAAANCHHAEDVDIYKINLGTAYNSYTVRGELYHRNNDGKNHTLNVQVYYSTNGSTWYKPESNEWWTLTVAGETLYLKIVPYSSYYYNDRTPGSYAAKLDITGGCTYTLSAVSKQATSEAGADQVTVTTHSSGNLSCPWTATSNVRWITFTSVQSGTATGNVSYAYTKNSSNAARTGTFTIAGLTYTVTQGAAPSLAPDGYEDNNSMAEARLLTPVFTQNTGTVSISPANCHQPGDFDAYKINLGNDYDSYTVTGVLYNRYNQIDNSDYTLSGELYYSINGSRWTLANWNRTPNLTVAAGGTFYLAVSSYYGNETGTYAAKIEIIGGCTYTLPAVNKKASYQSGTDQVTVTVHSSANVSCPRTAVSNDDWITLTSGQNETGSGNVGYTYTENTTADFRTGTITVGGQTYTLIQAGRPLSPDAYEPNNTVALATLLNPVFTQNAGTLSISQVNCHNADDVDIYKINLEAGSYSVSAMLSDSYNDSHYTLDAKISYSTNGATWSESKDSQWTMTVQGGVLYLRVEAYSTRREKVGTYAAKIDVLKITPDCTYSLTDVRKQAPYEAGTGQVSVTTGSSCAWTATTGVTWIKFTSEQSKTGPGNVSYSYTENMSMNSRTGIITIAGQIYTVTQPAHPLSPDGYEENNTVEQAAAHSTFTPVFTQNASSISISPANCHQVEDVDIYKINLEAGSYSVSTVLSDRSARINHNNFTLDATISYSTDGTKWSREYSGYSQLPNLTVQGGTLYLKIVPSYYGNRVGFYAVKIDILKITADCTYSLPVVRKEGTYEAGTGQVDVTTGSSCAWTATASVAWIKFTSDQSKTGPGNVRYSYTENMALDSRTGIITIAGQTYTITQTAHPLSPDGYEENNTVEQAAAHSSFTPVFTQNASSISISPANCHNVEDVDIYKINLGAGSYSVSTVLSDRSARINDNNYTLDATISYSTDGTNWSKESGQLPNLTVQGGTLYLKIAPYNNGNRVGFYAVKIDILKITADCTYKLSATSQEAAGSAGTGKIDITTTGGSSCGWTATSKTNWLTITSGEKGTGSGSTEYAYTENNTGAPRTGTITVAGQTYTVNQSIVTGIETTARVKIFPNPAKDFVTIDFSGNNTKYVSVKIANQLGQIVYVQNNPNGTLQIPLKGLTGGVYFIFLQGEEKMWVEKLVVK